MNPCPESYLAATSSENNVGVPIQYPINPMSTSATNGLYSSYQVGVPSLFNGNPWGFLPQGDASSSYVTLQPCDGEELKFTSCADFRQVNSEHEPQQSVQRKPGLNMINGNVFWLLIIEFASVNMR